MEEKSLYLKAADDAIYRAIIQLIPTVGGAVDTLIFHKADQIKFERLQKFTDETRSDLTRLKERIIDKEFLQSEEFLFIAEEVLKQILNEYNQEKIDLFKTYFVNSVTSKPHEYTHRDYLSTLSSITPRQLMIFKQIIENGSTKTLYDNLQSGFYMSRKQIESMFGILFGLGLLDQAIVSDADGENDEISVESRMSYALSDYGKSFKRFLELG